MAPLQNMAHLHYPLRYWLHHLVLCTITSRISRGCLLFSPWTCVRCGDLLFCCAKHYDGLLIIWRWCTIVVLRLMHLYLHALFEVWAVHDAHTLMTLFLLNVHRRISFLHPDYSNGSCSLMNGVSWAWMSVCTFSGEKARCRCCSWEHEEFRWRVDVQCMLGASFGRRAHPKFAMHASGKSHGDLFFLSLDLPEFHVSSIK